jgi:hypothetical protein
MGMGAMLVSLLVAVSLGSYALGWIARSRKEDKKIEWSLRRRLLLTEAMALVHQFLNPTNLNDTDYASKATRQQGEKLLQQYEKEVKGD